jgi:hypothetical protein
MYNLLASTRRRMTGSTRVRARVVPLPAWGRFGHVRVDDYCGSIMAPRSARYLSPRRSAPDADRGRIDRAVTRFFRIPPHEIPRKRETLLDHQLDATLVCFGNGNCLSDAVADTLRPEYPRGQRRQRTVRDQGPPHSIVDLLRWDCMLLAALGVSADIRPTPTD